MDLVAIYPYLLPCFFVVAVLHSSVGLAGGSSYTAVMAVFGVPLSIIPSISLSLNALVSSIGTRNFVKHQHFRPSLWLPFQLGALPMVYLGARIQLPALLFYAILLFTLLASALRLAIAPQFRLNWQLTAWQRLLISLVAGAVLGFLSGSIGIGGGIYLLPCILLLGLGDAKEAAAVAVIFILINSLIGLATKWQMGLLPLAQIWPAMLTVAAGGALGSWLGASQWHNAAMLRALLLILLIASALLIHKIIVLLLL